MSTLPLELESAVLERAPKRPQGGEWRLTRRQICFAALALWVASGLYLVGPDQQALVTRAGRVVAPRAMPGLHYALPWPIEIVTRLKVRNLQRLVVGGELTDSVLGRTQPLRSQFLTGDQNLIHLRAVVQFSIGTPGDYLFRAENPAQLVGATVETELARRVARRGVDAVLTTERIAIQDEVRTAAQRLLNGYGAGVLLSTVNIEIAAPPSEAAEAFRDVASARADTSRIISQAQGYANDLIPRARGQAQQLLQEGEGYRQRKIDEATGDAARFNQVAAEYSRAAQVTRRRLYLEAMEEILPRIRKLIVDPAGNVDLTIIRKGDAPAGARR
jgi:modulator of FtsH protease HflK